MDDKNKTGLTEQDLNELVRKDKPIRRFIDGTGKYVVEPALTGGAMIIGALSRIKPTSDIHTFKVSQT